MATIYVDSNATGANNGTSFTDAFTSIASVVEANDDIVLIASNHSESVSTDPGVNSGVSDGVFYISVNSTTEDYETGASITFTASTDFRNTRFYGCTIALSGASDLEVPVDRAAFFHECTVSFDTINLDGSIHFEDCTVTGNTSGNVITADRGFFKMVGGSFTASNSGTGDRLFGFNAACMFIGVDLTGVNSEFLITNGVRLTEHFCLFHGCSLRSGQSFLQNNGGINLEVVNCISGTTTDRILEYKYESEAGDTEEDTSVTRTNGASDGTTSYTMKMTATANKTRKSLRGVKNGLRPIAIPVSSTDTNVRIYIAHNAVGSGASGVLQSDECWAEYQGPSQDATADGQMHYITTKTDFGVTPTNLTTDSSTWSGTGVGTRQRIDITIDPTEDGEAHVWLYFAPESGSDQTIHFDPKIDVT